MKKVLIVVDMQKDFVDGALGTKEAVAIVPKVASKVKEYIERGEDIVFTMDTHFDNYLDTSEGKKLPVKHCIKNTEGWQIIPELSKYTENIHAKVIEKSTFGSVKLPEIVELYDRYEIVGLCTDICVISNAMLLKAHFPEKMILVDGSCCAGVTPESHDNALSAMKMCQIDILDGEADIPENDIHDLKQDNEIDVKKGIYMQTFGNFEMFIDGEPVRFSRSKAKELIAFLVDRKGAGVSSAEIAAVLWEDKVYTRSLKNQVQTIVGSMMEALKSYGVDDIIIKRWNSLSIDTTKITCDYYKFLERDAAYINRFAGEYMSNYSWSEFTTGYLTESVYKRR